MLKAPSTYKWDADYPLQVWQGPRVASVIAVSCFILRVRTFVMEGGEKVGKLAEVMKRITSIARETAHLPVPNGSRIDLLSDCIPPVGAVTLPSGIAARNSSSLFDPVALHISYFERIPYAQLPHIENTLSTLQADLSDVVCTLRTKVQKEGTCIPLLNVLAPSPLYRCFHSGANGHRRVAPQATG